MYGKILVCFREAPRTITAAMCVSNSRVIWHVDPPSALLQDLLKRSNGERGGA